MKGFFLDGKLDYTYTDGSTACAVFDKNDGLIKRLNYFDINLHASDDIFIYLVCGSRTDLLSPYYNNRTLFCSPIAKPSFDNLIKIKEFDTEIHNICTNGKNYIFVSFGKFICIIKTNLDNSSESEPFNVISLIECKNEIIHMSAHGEYFVYADGMKINVLQSDGCMYNKYFTMDNVVKHSIKYIGVHGNRCIIISSKTTLVHILNLLKREINPPVRLGYLWRNIRSTSMNDKLMTVISDKSLHVVNFDSNNFHKIIDIDDINALDSLIIKDCVHVLDGKKGIIKLNV